MPRYISLGGNLYGITCDGDGGNKRDSVPNTMKANDSTIATRVLVSQNEHVAQAKGKK